MDAGLEMTFDGLNAALKEYAEEVRALYRQRLILDDKYASGKLIQNLKTYVKAKGVKYEVGLYLMDYWKYVEEGRRPGKFPPPDKILEWIKIKPVLPDPDKDGRIPTPEQLSFLIGRKIADSGITAGHQLKETVDQVNARWLPKLQQALQEDFEGYVIRVFEKAMKLVKI